MKNRSCIWLLAAGLLGALSSGCTRNFSASLKDGLSGSAVPSDRSAQVNAPAVLETPGTQGGQPGAITVAGVLIQSVSGQLQLQKQITVLQVGGKNSQGKNSGVRSENALQLLPQPKMERLEQMEDRADSISLGCDTDQPQIAAFIKGLKPQPLNLNSKDSMELKANTVLLCGKLKFSQAFVTILAEHLVLMGTDYEVPNFEGVGFLSVQTQKLTLIGTNSISTRGQDSAGAIADGPTILFAAQKELQGSGNLKLSTFGGDRLQTGSGK